MSTIAITDAVTKPRVDDEQVLYAAILEVGVYLGLAILVVTFALYGLGIVSPTIPLHELPSYWSMSVHEYLQVMNTQHLHHDHIITGWQWVSVIGKGDYLNYVGIVLLAGVSGVCFLGIIPTLLRKHDRVYATMAALEVLVLALAASGLLEIGH
jgi:hypothetical protein